MKKHWIYCATCQLDVTNKSLKHVKAGHKIKSFNSPYKKVLKATATLLFIGLVWSTPARATLFTYDISLTMLAASLQQPLYGDVRLAAFFTQDTGRDSPYYAPDLPRELWPKFGVNSPADLGSMFWGLSAISPTDIRFAINEYAGFLTLDLLYDQQQVFNAPFREPDRLAVTFGYELGWLCAPLGPCTLGTGGTHTFQQGEFNFARDHAVPEPGSMVLAGAGLVGVAVVLRRRRGRK